MVKRDGERRRRSDRQPPIRDQVEPPVANRIFTTLGAEAADRWLRALGLPTVPRWFVEITMLGADDTRFDLNVYMEEWGFTFQHAGRTSWIRVTDVAFVHGRDEHGLLAKTPDLFAISMLLAKLEMDHHISFQRATASVRTNVPDAANVVRDWLLQPLPYSGMKKTTELCGDEMQGHLLHSPERPRRRARVPRRRHARSPALEVERRSCS